MRNRRISQLLYRLPVTQRFITRLVDDLGERRNLLLLLPDWINAEELLGHLRDELLRRDFIMCEVLLPKMMPDCPPTVALGEKLGISWPASLPRIPANLAELSVDTDIIQLVGLNELPDSSRRVWCEFLLQWSQGFQNIMDRGGCPAVICLICSAWALDSIPPENLYLSVRKWWGMPSALEMKLLCRLAEGDDVRESLAFGWRESILSSIAGSDVQLAEWLWDDVFLTLDHLTECLVNYALEKRDWSVKMLVSLNVDGCRGWTENNEFPGPYPKNFELWGRGVLSWTLDYGVEINSSALALFGRKEEIQHRLWRAQASLLLPRLDSLRLGVCKHLTRKFGPEWPVRWPKFATEKELDEAKENPFSCQWGYLENIIGSNVAMKSERNYLPLIQSARYIRNRLAHYRIIEYSNYRRLCSEIQDHSKVLLL